MTDQTPHNLPATRLARTGPEAGEPAPHDVLEGLSAGQYWRARRDIPNRYREEVDEQHAMPWEKEDDGLFERDGQAFVRRVHQVLERDAVPGGMVLLVKSLRHLDGDVHTVVMAPHPTEEDGDERRFLLDEFLEHFEPELEPGKVRAREIQAVNDEMARLQAEMIEGPKDAPALPALPLRADVTSLVALAPRAEGIAQDMDRHLAVAQERTAFIQERTKAMMGQAELLARFHNEKSEAALAAVEATISKVKRIQKGLRSLKLYTGEGLDVWTVLKGESAPPDEPLTIYQRRLYLDEELAVALEDGGLDSSSLDRVDGFFQANPRVLERMAPAPRSMVLLSLRRRVDFPKEKVSLAEAFEMIAKAKADTQSMLLIRDGGNAHLVWSDLIWSYDGKGDDFDANGLKRLFPSRDDADKPFRGTRGRAITPESLDFTDAKERFEDRALAYKRLLLATYGLHERLGIFGEFYDRADPRFSTWFSEEFQAERLRFVADDELAIEHKRESVFQYAGRMNAYLRSGSRVLVLWPKAVTPETAPGCFDRPNPNRPEDRPFRRWRPAREWDIVTARRKGEDVVVETTVDYHYSGKPQTRNVVVNLSAYADDEVAFLCLDAARLPEVEHFVESRREREHYLQYLWLFMHARAHLRVDEARQAPVIEEMTRAAVGAGLGDEDTARAAMREAARLWRADNRGADLKPRAEDPKAFRRMLDVAFVLLGKDRDLAREAHGLAVRLGRAPVRLSIDGSARLVLYAGPTEEERIDDFGPHPWAARLVLTRANGCLAVQEGPTFVDLKELIGSESVLARFEADAEYVAAKPYKGLSHKEAKGLVDAIEGAGATFARQIVQGEPDPAFLRAGLALMKTTGRMEKDGYATYTTRHPMRHPIGIITYEPGKYGVLVLQMDPLHVHARAGAAQEAEVRRRLSQFTSPAHMRSLERDLEAPRPLITYMQVRDWLEEAAKPGFGWHEAGWTLQDSLSSKSPWRESVKDLHRGRYERNPETRQNERVYPPLEEVVVRLPETVRAWLDEIDRMEEERKARLDLAEPAPRAP